MTEFADMQCLLVPFNDRAGGYNYPAEARFDIEEQDLPSHLRAAGFLNIMAARHQAARARIQVSG